ncbi:hypothetical protein T4C_9183 [Trichinella pseudospiralis]|uniref:Uncharacterized protein n=1 Tax=Trichinella pseudospiralis TaxID=6337 RepID=A0A0V1K1Y1_TRIPS|nr:hypothetical protein T4C_9183 [Trichinella pseudospiralis]
MKSNVVKVQHWRHLIELTSTIGPPTVCFPNILLIDYYKDTNTYLGLITPDTDVADDHQKKHLRKLPHLLGLPFDILEFHSLTSGKTRVVIGQRWSNRKDTARYAIGLYSFITGIEGPVPSAQTRSKLQKHEHKSEKRERPGTLFSSYSLTEQWQCARRLNHRVACLRKKQREGNYPGSILGKIGS